MKAIKERGGLFSLASACKHKYQKKKKKKANRQPVSRSIETDEPMVELENSQNLSSEYYDDGMPLVLQYSIEENDEDSSYPSNEIEDIEFVESKTSNSFDYNEGYVEPFEAEVLNNETDENQEEFIQKLSSTKELKEDANQDLRNDNLSNSKQTLKEEKPKNEVIEKPKNEILKNKNIKENSVKDHSSDEILKAITESEVDDSFEDDIKAILSGSKKYDPKKKKVLPASGSSTSNPSGSNNLFGEDGKMPEFKNNQHDIFNKIAQNLSFSNSYDLGSIALDHKFDSFDKEIEEVDVKKKGERVSSKIVDDYVKAKNVDIVKPTSLPSSTTSDTSDFFTDINKISKVQSAQTSTQPTNQLTLNPELRKKADEMILEGVPKEEVEKFLNSSKNLTGALENIYHFDDGRKTVKKNSISDPPPITDNVTIARINTLHPSIRGIVRELMRRSEGENGQRLRITDGFRGEQEQNFLYAQNRNQVQVDAEKDAWGKSLTGIIAAPEKKWATNASWGKSYHNYGLAIDVVGYNNNIIDYNIDWNKYHKLGQELGGVLVDGDRPHLSFNFGIHWTVLKNLPRDDNGFVIFP